jgi:hypothetical protein
MRNRLKFFSFLVAAYFLSAPAHSDAVDQMDMAKVSALYDQVIFLPPHKVPLESEAAAKTYLDLVKVRVLSYFLKEPEKVRLEGKEIIAASFFMDEHEFDQLVFGVDKEVLLFEKDTLPAVFSFVFVKRMNYLVVKLWESENFRNLALSNHIDPIYLAIRVCNNDLINKLLSINSENKVQYKSIGNSYSCEF